MNKMELLKLFYTKSFESYSTLASQSFGRLLRPRERTEKMKQSEILDRIPYDMADSWFERNEILMKRMTQYMPEQFAEASVKYSSTDVDFLLNTLFNQCLNYKSEDYRIARGPPSSFVPKMDDKFVDNVLERVEENLGNLSGAECGIILKCFAKLKIRKDELNLKLIKQILSRKETFTKHGLIASLNTLVSLINECNSRCTYKISEPIRQFNTALSIVLSNLENFEISLISQIVNIISRSNLNVSSQLKQISSYILEKYSKCMNEKGDNDAKNESNLVFVENDIYYLTNGFSRKNILNKKLFDYFGEIIMDNCPCYNIDTLVSIANSYSKFGNVIDSGYLDLFCKLAERVVIKPSQLNTLHVSVLANAFSKAYLCHEHLFKILLDKFTISYHLFTPRQIAMTLHSVTKIQYKSNNQHYLFHRAFQDLNIYCWHSLTMLFQSYVKSECVDENTTKMFCEHFYNMLKNRSISNKNASPTFDEDLLECSNEIFNERVGDGLEYNEITLLSLIYSLVKTGSYQHEKLLQLISEEIFKKIENYKGDEVVNLIYSFCKIYRYSKNNKINSLLSISEEILNKLIDLVNRSKENMNGFSIVKIIRSFGEIRYVQASHLVLKLIKKNIAMLQSLSYPQINTVIHSFSTLGISDIDVTTILNTLKNKKKLR